MNEPTPTVRLKNGTEEEKPLVAGVMYSLRKLFEEGKGLVVFELVKICKDSSHHPWGSALREDLKSLPLVEERDHVLYVDDSVRNIVLSAMEGEGLDMTIVNPVAETPRPAEAPA